MHVYHLSELPSVHIDSWVNGISNMCDIDDIRKEVYDMAGVVEDENNPICPGEFETEYNELAEKYNFRFDSNGHILSYNREPRARKPQPTRKEQAMKTFTVTVNWEVSKAYEVEADTAEEARAKIQKLVDDGEVCVWTDGFEATDKVEVEAESTIFKVVNVTNIDWDTSDYDDDDYDPASPNIPDLPSEVSDVDLRLDPDEADNEEYIEEAISDWLSDVYGFCVNSFSYEKVKNN